MAAFVIIITSRETLKETWQLKIVVFLPEFAKRDKNP